MAAVSLVFRHRTNSKALLAKKAALTHYLTHDHLRAVANSPPEENMLRFGRRGQRSYIYMYPTRGKGAELMGGAINRSFIIFVERTFSYRVDLIISACT